MKAKIYITSFIISALCFDTFGQSTTILPNSNIFKGSVGIGANAPRGIFDVNAVGDIYLNANPNAGSTQSVYLPGHLFLAPYSNSNISYLQARRGDNSGSTELQFRTFNSGSIVDALRINSLGYVGIGLTNPNAPFHMKSKVNSVTFKIENSDLTHNNLEIGEDIDNQAYLTLNNNVNEQMVKLGVTSYFKKIYPNEFQMKGKVNTKSFWIQNSDLVHNNLEIGEDIDNNAYLRMNNNVGEQTVKLGTTSLFNKIDMKAKVNQVSFSIENSDYTHKDLIIGEDGDNNPYLRLNNNVNEQVVKLGATSSFLGINADGIGSTTGTIATFNSTNITTNNIAIGGYYNTSINAGGVPLFVAKEANSQVAIFENRNPYGEGIAIRVKANSGGSVYGANTNFIRFAHWYPSSDSYLTNGVIEGFKFSEWNLSPITGICDVHDLIGIPDSFIGAALAAVNAEVAAACMDDGVRYKSTGADYAEYLPKEDPKSKILPASVVGVKNGKISYKTEGADQVMAISTRAVVLGNMPQADKKDEYETVAFIGQVHVWVVGEVKSGDFIVASGKNNGTAIAISPENLEINDIPNIVGRAWETKNLPINLVNTVVGVKTSEVFEILKKESAKTKALEASVADLKSEFINFKNSRNLSTNK